jgi:hypothetical protein
VTIGVVAALLAFDLWLATVRPHAAGYREAAAWSALYIEVAVVFGLVFASLVGWGTAPGLRRIPGGKEPGPPLPDGSDMAAIPGSPSAWMVGAWPAPRTGLTAEVRLSR